LKKLKGEFKMPENTDQPFPQEQTTEPTAGLPEKKESSQEEKAPKDIVGKVTAVLKKLTGESKKTKLILVLSGITIASLFLLILVALLKPKPHQETVTPAPPTPTPMPITPTPAPEKTKEAIDDLIIDVEEFDPSQKDLQSPVVDLEIGL
jgi:hypothetical protein